MNGLSLCSGIGLLDLAFERAGGTVVMQCEIDPWCRKVLTKHWPNVPKHDDMKTLEYNGNEPIDIIFGGIPCQPFSQSGSKHGKSDDRHLWPYALTIIKKYRPRWVCIENVPSFIEVVFDELATDLEALCYQTEAVILPSCAIGAPHVRERACIIASRMENANSARWGAQQPEKHQSNTKGHAEEFASESVLNGAYIGISQSRMGRTTHGDTARLDGTVRFPAYQNEPQHEWEAPRVIEKRVKDHAKRLKAIGNGVVVPLWQEIFKTIIDVGSQGALV